MSTQHIKQVALTAIAALAMSTSALAQDDESKRGRDRGDAAEAATEAFGFTEEQVDKIREIRRERPPRRQSSEEREAWRAEQQAKVEAVLTDEQQAKIAELNEMREKMRDFAIAARMGLVDGRGGAAAIQRVRGALAVTIARERAAEGAGRAEDGVPAAAAARIAARDRTAAAAGLAAAAAPKMPDRSSPKRGGRVQATVRSHARHLITINRSVLQGGLFRRVALHVSARREFSV